MQRAVGGSPPAFQLAKDPKLIVLNLQNFATNDEEQSFVYVEACFDMRSRLSVTSEVRAGYSSREARNDVG